MKTKTSKQAKGKGLTPGVTTLSFEPGFYFEFTELGMELPKRPEEKPDKKPANGNGAAKKKANVQDRRYLRDIEIWLNNCVNFAERLEGKQAAKILQLLTEARERTIRLRG